MKPRDYCCCAIPLVNVGIYVTLVVQFALAILVGALSVGTPHIVGAATPSFSSWILGIICFVAAALQVLGFVGVAKEKTILYRRYATLHLLINIGAFAVAATWIVVSATRHGPAKSKCLLDFFPIENRDTEQAKTLCEIFAWVDIGIMGALWIILAIVQIYLYVVISSYGAGQRHDHAQYAQLGDPVNADAIPMNARGDPWDARPSTDLGRAATTKGLGHSRQDSELSVSDVMNEPYQKPKEALGQHGYGYQDAYPVSQQYDDYDNRANYSQQRGGY
jgi:hypothetical protein